MGRSICSVSATGLMAIVLLSATVPTLMLPEQAIALSGNPVAKEEISEIDQAIAEGLRLFQEGSKESLITAISQFETGLQLSRAKGDRSRQALAALGLGSIYDALGDKPKALDHYNQALLLYRALRDPSGEALALNNIGRVYDELGDKQKALQYLNQVLLQYRALRDPSGEALALNNIGSVYKDLGDNLKALKYYNQALPLIPTASDSPEETRRQSIGKARTLNNIGGVYNALGDKSKALEYHNQALLLMRAARDRGGEASALNNIGSVYDALGDKPKALDYYNQALLLLRAVGDASGEAYALNNIGSVYDDLGDRPKALDYYNQALPLWRMTGNLSGEAMTFHNVGTVYEALGDKSKALGYYNQALSLTRTVGDPSGEAYALNNIGSVYDDLGDKPKALNYLNQALPLWNVVGDRGGRAMTLNHIGNVYSALGDKPKALNYYSQALPLYRMVRDPIGEAKTLNNIGAVYGQKQPKLAIAFYKKSVNIYETLRTDLKSLTRTEQALYTQTIAYTYRNLADLLIQQGRLTEAQQVIDLLKIRELKELEVNKIKSTTVVQQVPIDESEKQAIAKVNSDVAKEIQSQSLPPIDRLSPSNPLNRSAQALLTAQPNAALIYQLFTQDKLWLILITPDGKLQRFASTANQAKIESIVTAFRAQIERCEKQNYTCDQTDTKNLNKISQELHQQLFPPDLQAALKQAQPNHLIFALDGSLRNIPMAALHDGKAYLAQQYALSSIIAAQLTDTQDKIPANTSQSPVLAVGVSRAAAITVPDYINKRGQDRYPALSNVPSELNAIVPPNNATAKSPSSFPGKQLLDSDFNLANLQKYLPQYGILHIASHGIFRPNSLDYSYILMGNSQRWSIAQMDSPDGIAQDKTKTKLFQNIHMVSISTCQSGLGGRDTNGIEIAGMSHAFLSQGAKTVTASLWQVNDGSTRVLMNHFYQNLAQNPNQSKAKSLQTAQLYLLQTPETTLGPERRYILVPSDKPIPSPAPDKIPDYKHPYFWASFTLIGNSL
jgi:CHAT domain-containing protein/Tfp pilus assembly protein PilF